MADTITIIAYRSDGIDTCRGCVMERFSSEFDMGIFDDIKPAAVYYAKLVHSNKINNQNGRSNWDINVLINGKATDIADFYIQTNAELAEPEEGLLNLFRAEYYKAQIVVEREHALWLEKEAAKKLREEERRKVVERNTKHAQYLKLKEEFEK